MMLWSLSAVINGYKASDDYNAENEISQKSSLNHALCFQHNPENYGSVPIL